MKGRVFRKRLTSEETQEGVPKAWYNQYQQFFEDMDKSHLMDSCQEYGWDKSVCDRQGAMDETECEKAIQEMSKQCKAKEAEYPMLRSNQQLVLRSVGGQTRERERGRHGEASSFLGAKHETVTHTRKSRKIPRKSGGANNHRRAHCIQCSLSPLDRSTSPSKPFSTTLSHTSERTSQQARLQTLSLFPRLHCCSLALLFMYYLSSALGNAPLSSSILFLAMFHKPFCAVKRPTSNSSFRLFHSFLGKSFSFDCPPFHLSVSAKNMGPSHSLGIFICLLLLLHFMQRYLLAAHTVRCFFASLFYLQRSTFVSVSAQVIQSLAIPPPDKESWLRTAILV